jgi:hypothetical protein
LKLSPTLECIKALEDSGNSTISRVKRISSIHTKLEGEGDEVINPTKVEVDSLIEDARESFDSVRRVHNTSNRDIGFQTGFTNTFGIDSPSLRFSRSTTILAFSHEVK